MKWRHLAAWFSGVALLGTGATVLWGQPPQAPREVPARTQRDQIRAEVVRLRTEVEMLRFDYELKRDGFLEELKISRGLRMGGQLFSAVGAIQSAINRAGEDQPGEAAKRESEQDRKKAAEEAKAAEQEEKKEAAAEAAAIAEAKKELARLYSLLAEKRLELEDAERLYREPPPPVSLPAR
jgi:hypothetical protein